MPVFGKSSHIYGGIPGRKYIRIREVTGCYYVHVQHACGYIVPAWQVHNNYDLYIFYADRDQPIMPA